MHQAIIYSPAKTSMQSGSAKTKFWVLEFKNNTMQTNNPLMGWIGGGNTENQIHLKFDTLDEAVRYAQNNQISYTVKQPKIRNLSIKSYAENYAFNNREPWSH
jgi:ETC complex I subunit conserved region